MIVDVLRNDLGRVCRPGHASGCRGSAGSSGPPRSSTSSRRSPARSRRAATPFDLLAASFPGGSITGAPKIRAMEILARARADPARAVHRRARLDRAGRRDADQHPDPDVRRRRPPADAPRRRRDHLPERPGGANGTRPSPRRAARSARSAAARSPMTVASDEPATAATSGSTAGSLPADAPHLSAFDRGFQLGDGIFETLRARGGPPDRAGRACRPAAPLGRGLAIPLAGRPRRRSWPAIADLLAAEGLDGPDGRRERPDHGVARGVPRPRPPAARRASPAPTIVDPGLAGRRRRRPTSRARPAPRRQRRPARPGEPARRP